MHVNMSYARARVATGECARYTRCCHLQTVVREYILTDGAQVVDMSSREPRRRERGEEAAAGGTRASGSCLETAPSPPCVAYPHL